MNKKLTAFFAGYNMTVDGNSAYGNVKGYETSATIVKFDNVAPVRFHVSFYATDEQKRKIEADIRNMTIKFFKMQFSPYGLTLGFNDLTLGKLLKRLPTVLDGIYAVISESGAMNGEYCPVCGEPLDRSQADGGAPTFKKCKIDGFTVTIDNDCVSKINSVISEENADFDNAPNNYLRGFLGALIGGLVGAGISILLYVVGFVSSISAIVAIVLGSFLYQKFKGKPNKMMILIVSVTCLILLAATVPTIYIVASDIAAKDLGLSMSAMEAFRICMQDSEFSAMFYSDLALIILFSAIGTGIQIYIMAKQIKRKNNI